MTGEDTIAAVASGYSSSGISVIRISGSEALCIADRVFVTENGKKLVDSLGYRAYFGHIYNDRELVDEGVALVMRNPHSYTGEDTVEISCHGGPLVTRKVLQVILNAGCRPAEPGEFSKRAFLNGKMDLARAEAVIDLIDAKNEFARKASVNQLTGRLSDMVNGIRDELLDDCAYIEAALDDPEHISLDEFSDSLKAKLIENRKQLEILRESFNSGRQLKEGIKTVILGKPNAGKSSLMNIFAGREMAIVTDIAGTTRDVLSENVSFGGTSFELIDTAGIRETEDKVEKIGVERSVTQARDADLILYVVDSSTPLEDEDKQILELIGDKKCIIVYNKTDLVPVVSMEEIKGIRDTIVVPFSAKDGSQLSNLVNEMQNLFVNGEIMSNDQIVLTNIRHEQEVGSAIDSIDAVINSMDLGFSEDLWTIDLNDAIAALGRILGLDVDDDVVNRVFEKFCMGK